MPIYVFLSENSEGSTDKTILGFLFFDLFILI
jgi:hypothetical protein